MSRMFLKGEKHSSGRKAKSTGSQKEALWGSLSQTSLKWVPRGTLQLTGKWRQWEAQTRGESGSVLHHYNEILEARWLHKQKRYVQLTVLEVESSKSVVEALVRVPPPWLTIHGRRWYQEHVKAETIGPNGKPVRDQGSALSMRELTLGDQYSPPHKSPRLCLFKISSSDGHNGHACKPSIHEAGAGGLEDQVQHGLQGKTLPQNKNPLTLYFCQWDRHTHLWVTLKVFPNHSRKAERQITVVWKQAF